MKVKGSQIICWLKKSHDTRDESHFPSRNAGRREKKEAESKKVGKKFFGYTKKHYLCRP